MSNLVLKSEQRHDGHAVVLHVHPGDGSCFKIEGSARYTTVEDAHANGMRLHAILSDVLGPNPGVVPRGASVH